MPLIPGADSSKQSQDKYFWYTCSAPDVQQFCMWPNDSLTKTISLNTSLHNLCYWEPQKTDFSTGFMHSQNLNPSGQDSDQNNSGGNKKQGSHMK